MRVRPLFYLYHYNPRPKTSRNLPEFFALFCTADQPASCINALLGHAEEDKTGRGNLFCLIESPDQKRVDKPTSPTASEDLKTGFKGWSTDQLGKFCKEKFDHDNPRSQPPYISDENFAVLDERTLKDGTVLLVRYSSWMERINPDDPSDADDAFRHLEGYRTVRAKRKAAPELMFITPGIDIDEVISHLRPEDNGVWRAPEEE